MSRIFILFIRQIRAKRFVLFVMKALSSFRGKLHYPLLLAVFLLGFALRVYRADHQEIWGDEGIKLEVVHHDFAHVLDPTAEFHPRLFHLFLFFWHRIFGFNVFGLRILPALLGVLGLPALYVLARRLFASRTAGLVASFLLALSPFHISYSQDLTMYGLLFLTMTLSFYFLVLIFDRPDRSLEAHPEHSREWWRPVRSPWIGYVTFSILAVHAHYYAAFALIAQNIFVLLWQRKWLKQWIIAQATIAIGTLPWLYLQYEAVARSGQGTQQLALTLSRLIEILMRAGVAFTVGLIFPSGWTWVAWIYLAVVMLGLLQFPLIISRSFSHPHPSPLPSGEREQDSPLPAGEGAGVRGSAGDFKRPHRSLLGLWLLLPPLFIWLADAWLGHFGERFLILSLAPFLLLLTWAFCHLPWRRVLLPTALAAYTITSFVSLRAWYFDPAFLKSHYGEMMVLIEQNAQPGDVLLLDGPEQKMLFEIYHPPGLDYRFISPDSVLTDARAERDFPGLIAGYRRAWLVLYGEPKTYDPEHQAEAWLARKGYKAFYQSYVGNYVTLFAFSGSQAESALNSIEAQFESGPRLIGYALEPATLQPGQTLYVTLQWLATDSMPVDYTVFTHLLNSAGELVAQTDSQPMSGTRPTSSWQPSEVITDRYALLLPLNLEPGNYQIEVGLYDLASLNRLVISQPGRAADQLDHLILATTQVQSEPSR